MLPFTTARPREVRKPLQGHAARTRDLRPQFLPLLCPQLLHPPAPTSPRPQAQLSPSQRCPGDQKGGWEEGASLIEMHCSLRTSTWRVRSKKAARRGGGCGLAPTWVREKPDCFPAIRCLALPGNELPGPKVSFPRLLTPQPRGTKEHRYFFSSLPDSSLEELIYSSIRSLKDIIYWLIVVITKC